MIQSFSIVFAGYKMPACLRPAMSSPSAWYLCRGLGLRSVPITGTIRHYNTLSHLLSTLSIDQTLGMEEPRVLPDRDYS